MLNLVCLAEMYPGALPTVENILRLMLGDERHVIVERNGVAVLARTARQQYKRGCDPYPFQGNCLDFGCGTPFVEGLERIGQLVLSEDFPARLQSDPTGTVAKVREFLVSGNAGDLLNPPR